MYKYVIPSPNSRSNPSFPSPRATGHVRPPPDKSRRRSAPIPMCHVSRAAPLRRRPAGPRSGPRGPYPAAAARGRRGRARPPPPRRSPVPCRPATRAATTAVASPGAASPRRYLRRPRCHPCDAVRASPARSSASFGPSLLLSRSERRPPSLPTLASPIPANLGVCAGTLDLKGMTIFLL